LWFQRWWDNDLVSEVIGWRQQNTTHVQGNREMGVDGKSNGHGFYSKDGISGYHSGKKWKTIHLASTLPCVVPCAPESLQLIPDWYFDESWVGHELMFPSSSTQALHGQGHCLIRADVIRLYSTGFAPHQVVLPQAEARQ
jgi:hypothetical protein